MVRLFSILPTLGGLASALTLQPRELSPSAGNFIVDRFTTHNARQGDAFEANISGLLHGRKGTFSIVSHNSSDSESWAKVSPEGIISGTPGASHGDIHLVVRALHEEEDGSEIEVTIPVRLAGRALVNSLSVLSMNQWMGGSEVDDSTAKTVRAINEFGADIVGFQESSSDAGQKVAKSLGWYYWQSRDIAFISRYLIVSPGSKANARWGNIRVAIDNAGTVNGPFVNVWNVHLSPDFYGPYATCFDGKSESGVLADEERSERPSQIRNVLSLMKPELDNANNDPVILVGDFNAPSHLDYTEGRRSANCGYAGIRWPTSVQPINAGLTDSFRVAHTDPVARPGITWSPTFLVNEGRPEPKDRIDFIYYKGNKLRVRESENVLIGNPKPKPNQRANLWPSDHWAVLTRFDVVG
jgi:endonuclease/exonuclease/phosphatase family metal-dependent hydrolase